MASSTTIGLHSKSDLTLANIRLQIAYCIGNVKYDDRDKASACCAAARDKISVSKADQRAVPWRPVMQT